MKKNDDLITIIIPVYNSEKYLDECLTSAINQTYKNLEIIIIDDGSLDDSSKIYNKLKEKDNRIKIYKKANGGLSSARNHALDKCEGKYVFFLDSDDVIQNNTIETMHRQIVKYHNSIVICQLEPFKDKYNTSMSKGLTKYNRKDYINSVLLLKETTFACGVLIPSSFFKNVRFIEHRYYEDIASMYKIYDQCEWIIKLSSRNYKYRMNDNSIIHTPNPQKIADYLSSCTGMITYINKKQISNENNVNTYLCNAYRYCYILSKDENYLHNAKSLVKTANLKDISIRNKIKLYLLNSIILTKLGIYIKSR